jgi:zinc protease
MGGGGDLSMIDLQKKLADKVAGVRISIGELQEGVAASASPQDLETMFQLVYMYFTAPRRDEIAYQSLVSRVESVIENRSASPEAAYGDTLAVTLSQHHYRRRPLTPALLEELDLDEAMAFYRDRFADAGDFTFVFVGNFEVDAIEPLIETWIASLPATGRQETWRDIGIEAPGGIVSRTVRRGVEPKGATAIIFQGPFEYSRDNQYVLGSMSDVLSTMLREVLREDLGGTYGVNVSGSGALEPREEYSVSIEFGGDPARLDELTRQTFAVIDSLQTSGASEENLLKVTEQQRRARETDLRENGFWLSYLGHAYRVGWDPRLILRYDELLDGLTAAAIGEAARKYIDLDHYVQVSLVPEGSP